MNLVRHRCAALGCLVWVPGDLLMCLPHWRQVDEAAQSRFERAWAAWLEAEGEHYLPPSDLRDAQEAAVLDLLGRELAQLGLDGPGWHRGPRPWDLATAVADQPVSRSLGLDRAPERSAYLAHPADPALCRVWLRRVQAALAERGSDAR